MSRQYGPQTVAAGARMTFPIGKNAANVYIRNRSPFILRVWFGSDAPSDAMPTTAWHADVGPWEASPLGVLGGFHQAYRNIATYSNPAGFDGTVTLVAVTLDQSATITTATQYSVTLTSYEAAEAVPQPTATGTPQTITSGNQRVVSVPIVPQGGAFFFGTPPQGSGQPIVTSPTLGGIAPNVYANQFVNLYLYSLKVQTRNAGWTVFSITWQFLDQFNVVQGSLNVFGGIVDGSGTVADRVIGYESPYPLAAVNVGIPNPVFPLPRLRCVFVPFLQQNPGTNDFWVHATVGFDHINLGVPGSIGDFAQPVTGLINPATF